MPLTLPLRPVRRLAVAGLVLAAACFPSVDFGKDDGGASDAGPVGDDGAAPGDGAVPLDGGPVDGATSPDGAPGDAAVLDGVVVGHASVAVGSSHSCAIHGADRRVACWGRNVHLSLGRATNDGIDNPPGDAEMGIPAAPITEVEEVVAGDQQTCARRASGEVLCWGWDANAATGVGKEGDSDSPPTVVAFPAGAGAVVALTAVKERTCAVTRLGQVYCWGMGNLESDARWTAPVALPPGIDGGVAAIAVGQSESADTTGHQCVIPRGPEGRVVCWGLNYANQCGVATAGDASCLGQECVPKPTFIGLSGAAALGAHDSITCALHADGGKVSCWGVPYYGQLGTKMGAPLGRGYGPGIISGVDAGNAPLVDVSSISVGNEHVCAIVGPTRRALCWGDTTDGRVGNGVVTQSSSPAPSAVEIATGGVLTDVRTIAGAYGHTCAQKLDGSVYCWGLNDQGALGTASTALPRSGKAVLVTLPP